MKSDQDYSLKNNNTFAVDAVCPNIYYPTTIKELRELCQVLPMPFYVLGEGSNTLFIDEHTPNIIQPQITGISVRETDTAYFIDVGCAENWHQLVTFCVEHGYYGLENLALIPGSVGAAPVQNIGAYGVELADVLNSVTWFEFASQETLQFDLQACQFGYRDSIFKNTLLGKGVITSITLCLVKNWQPNLTYSGLDRLAKDSSAVDVYQRVVAIRQQKLPDPKILPNCGSFFKNPLVTLTKYRQLCTEFGDVPAYPHNNEQVKLAAGWLIDKAGLKGLRINDVGIHALQALVIVNFASTKGKPLAELAKMVQKKVEQKFGVLLQAEVRIICQTGITELNDQHSNEYS